MQKTFSEFNLIRKMTANEKLSLESNEIKVLRISSSNLQLIAKYPNNEDGRTFLLTNASGVLDFIVSDHPLNIGLYIHSLSDDTEFEFIPFNNLKSEEIKLICKTYSTLTRNILNKLFTGNINYEIENKNNLEAKDFMQFEIVKNNFIDRSNLYGFEDSESILKDNNLTIKSLKIKKLNDEILIKLQEQIAILGESYIEQFLKKEDEEKTLYASAELQNYQEAIDNLHEIFEKSKSIHHQTSLKSNSEIIKKFCEVNKINSTNFEYVNITSDLNIEESIARTGDVIGFRHRRISLKKDWYKKSHGNLLCLSNKGHLVIAQEVKPCKYSLINNTENLELGDLQIAYSIFKSFPQKINLYSLLSFALEGRMGDVLFLLLTTISGTLLGFVPPIVLGVLLSKAVPSSDIFLAWEFVGLLIVVSLGNALFSLTKSISQMRLETLLNTNVQTAVWDRVMKINPKFFTKYTPGELIDKIDNISEIRELLTGTATDTLLNGVFGFLHLILMYSYSPSLATPAIFIIIFIVLVTVGHRYYLGKYQRQLIVEEAKLKGFSGEIVGGIMKVKTSGFQTSLFRKYVNKYSNRTELSHACETIKDSNQALNVIFNPISTVIIYWVLVAALFGPELKNTINLGTYFAFNASFSILLSSVTELAEEITETFGEVEALYDHTKDIFEAPVENSEGEFVNVQNGSIEFKNVSFKYENSSNFAFSDVNFDLKSGSTLSLIGPTGSGKSTLAKLLLCFEKPSSGSILISGYDIDKANVKSLRSGMAAVMQGSTATAGSIYDFISSGIQVNQELFNKVLKSLNLEKLIVSLPMGLHTIISENGSNFSLAEQAKFLLARALVTKPKILIVDEAINKLDKNDSELLFQYLKKNSITLISISQDINLAKLTDSTLVIDKGKAYFGKFDEVIKQSEFVSNLQNIIKFKL